MCAPILSISMAFLAPLSSMAGDRLNMWDDRSTRQTNGQQPRTPDHRRGILTDILFGFPAGRRCALPVALVRSKIGRLHGCTVREHPGDHRAHARCQDREAGASGVELFVKLEAFNPLGSVKDRLALGVIEAAERSGELKPGQTVIEATSGNTGIGLAMVCAQKGYPLVVTMAENFSVERRKLMRFLGAKVVLTPASEKGSGMLAKAAELAQTHGWFLCRQFENEANPDFHSRTTAVEILEAFEGDRLDYWVTGMGTGGTLKGVARVLKKKRPETRIVVCEPDNSPLLGSRIPQDRGADGAPSESHPVFRPHPMQGWTPDFIPKLAEDAVRDGLIDEVLPVKGADRLAPRARARAKRGDLHRYHRRRHFRRRAADLHARREGREGPMHVAGHRGTLSEYALVRGHSRRDDRRGDRNLSVHAPLSV